MNDVGVSGALLATLEDLEARVLTLEALVTKKSKQPAKPKAVKKPGLTRGPLSEFRDHADVLENVTQPLQAGWIKAYRNVEWINQQIDKCKNWCLAKNVKTKDWGLRINNWLSHQDPPSAPAKKSEGVSL